MPKKSFGNLRPVSDSLLSIVGIVSVVNFVTEYQMRHTETH